jgi:hypothetical protein
VSGKKDLKKAFLTLEREVTDALNRADPIGLIAMSCPDDEYSPEVGTILPRLKEADSVLDLQRIIHEEFTHWLGPENAGPRANFAEAAQLIWAIMQTKTRA